MSKTRYRRKRRTRNKSSKARGISPISPNANIPCCMCERKFPRDKMFVPSACLRKNLERAHRICEDCWWEPQTGFAREDTHHSCPGCKKHLPLNPPIKSKSKQKHNHKPNEIIDISD